MGGKGCRSLGLTPAQFRALGWNLLPFKAHQYVFALEYGLHLVETPWGGVAVLSQFGLLPVVYGGFVSSPFGIGQVPTGVPVLQTPWGDMPLVPTP